VNARFAWLGAALGVSGAYVVRRLRRPAAEPVGAAADPRAEQLRERLAESRSLAGEREEFEAAETTVDRAEAVGESVEERRRRVHEHGREQVEEMRGEGDRPV
jgi:hypothetical protein